jgi:hypothetical protein
VSYPIEYIANARIPCIGPHPKNIILLCCDAFGVLPPVARLSTEQAMYHFISGYTAKVGFFPWPFETSSRKCLSLSSPSSHFTTIRRMLIPGLYMHTTKNIVLIVVQPQLRCSLCHIHNGLNQGLSHSSGTAKCCHHRRSPTTQHGLVIVCVCTGYRWRVRNRASLNPRLHSLPALVRVLTVSHPLTFPTIFYPPVPSSLPSQTCLCPWVCHFCNQTL